MRRYTLLMCLCLTVLLSACSGSSTLDKGKEELKAGKLDEALQLFEEAKIDDPMNEEIEKLISMTKTKISEESEKLEREKLLNDLDEYIDKIAVPVDQMSEHIKMLAKSDDLKSVDFDKLNKEADQYIESLNGVTIQGSLGGLSSDPNFLLGEIVAQYKVALNSAEKVSKYVSDGLDLNAAYDNGQNKAKYQIAISMYSSYHKKLLEFIEEANKSK